MDQSEVKAQELHDKEMEQRRRDQEKIALWQAVTAITDIREGVSVTIHSPNADFIRDGHDHAVTVDSPWMDDPRTIYGNDRLELLKEAKRLVEVAEEHGGKE